ncbi:DUF3107 domain-containing protein [Leekyejoonella antrihumi]|uniref:DUF3107 domain-containing protein n=1 Tax=Leekyejoonella antrihumi TaxID=1660198 RepID=A0A563DU18_9MICO|nr:DUF3107 domain-containing protein [Leekyejoonella antrihumi]TWP33747.1 DUF3107 domain-containing protein [Leekyejoonella antrihumi]
MEVRIGVQHVAREVVIESKQTPDEVREQVASALEKGTPLTLTDERGHTVTVPAAVLGYVDVGSEQPFKVGFGS